MTPEGKVKKLTRAILDEHGVWHFMPVSMGMGRHGIPDIIACFNGHFLAIECKAGKGRTTALQDRELAAITSAGGVAIVVSDDPATHVQLSEVLRKIKEQK